MAEVGKEVGGLQEVHHRAFHLRQVQADGIRKVDQLLMMSMDDYNQVLMRSLGAVLPEAG